MIRTSIPEDVGDAIDRVCEDEGVTPSVWMRRLVIQEVRAQSTLTGGAIYGCVCLHKRSDHRVERDRDGEFRGRCLEGAACEQYRQAAPPGKKS